MKPLLTATACILTATVVCAHISNEEQPRFSEEQSEVREIAVSKATISSDLGLHPSTYGVIGAAAMSLLIASRRQQT